MHNKLQQVKSASLVDISALQYHFSHKRLRSKYMLQVIVYFS